MPEPPVAPFESLQSQLREYCNEFPDETPVVDRFHALLDQHSGCFERDCWAGHVTGSAWLVDESGSDVLLTHHRKLDAWLQLGGHSDGDPNTAAVAMREAEEESGLRVALIRPAIFDIDIHEIPARKNDPAHFHFDVRYALVSQSGRDYRVSAESKDLAWVAIDAIHHYTTEASIARMASKWTLRRALYRSA
ncbi:MAG: NUDIX hydrolase [Xanthomonadaceae bacterium]|nr:NUDIX hydrolase [Xanthomonadaceae bacterium]